MVTPPMPPEVRAEALRVLVALAAGTPHLVAPEALELGLPPLTERDVAALELATEEDLALVNACLVVEYELRERAYAALERLCARASEEQGQLDERLRALPLSNFADAATCLYELGWVTPADTDDARA
jgi:hypothetical protein